MVRDHRLSLDGRQVVLPRALRGIESGLECLRVALVRALVVGIELRKLALKQSRNLPAILRVEPVVRIAERMYVTLAAIHTTASAVEHLNGLRDVDVAPAARRHLRIPRA